MAWVYLDRTDEGRFSVRVMTGAYGDKTKVFDARSEAEGFANKKMGRSGMVVSSLDMTTEQLARARGQ
jgi:hypothetical protein